MLLKYSSSDSFVDAAKSDWSALCDSEACSRVARSPGPNVLAGELSAANRTARWTDISFSTRSSAPRVATLPCRSASLAPAPTEALNAFAAAMTSPVYTRMTCDAWNDEAVTSWRMYGRSLRLSSERVEVVDRALLVAGAGSDAGRFVCHRLARRRWWRSAPASA